MYIGGGCTCSEFSEAIFDLANSQFHASNDDVMEFIGMHNQFVCQLLVLVIEKIPYVSLVADDANAKDSQIHTTNIPYPILRTGMVTFNKDQEHELYTALSQELSLGHHPSGESEVLLPSEPSTCCSIEQCTVGSCHARDRLTHIMQDKGMNIEGVSGGFWIDLSVAINTWAKTHYAAVPSYKLSIITNSNALTRNIMKTWLLNEIL